MPCNLYIIYKKNPNLSLYINIKINFVDNATSRVAPRLFYGTSSPQKIYTQKEVNIMKIGYRTDLDERRILGLIDDDTYYMLKRHEAALTYDVEEQQRLMRLQLLEKRQKQKREAEERQKKKQEQEKAEKEQEKAIKQAIEKDLPAKLEKALDKEFQKLFSKR